METPMFRITDYEHSNYQSNVAFGKKVLSSNSPVKFDEDSLRGKPW